MARAATSARSSQAAARTIGDQGLIVGRMTDIRHRAYSIGMVDLAAPMFAASASHLFSLPPVERERQRKQNSGCVARFESSAQHPRLERFERLPRSEISIADLDGGRKVEL